MDEVKKNAKITSFDAYCHKYLQSVLQFITDNYI